MPFLFCLALFVPPAAALAAGARRRFSEALPLVFLGLALLLCLLGMFGLLFVAVWLLYLAWAGCVAFLGLRLWRQLKTRAAKNRQWLWPQLGLVAFVLAAAVLWWLCRGVRFSVWDEFSHWGRAVKAAFGQQVLPAVAMGQDGFRDYPPGVAPLQALVLRAGGMPFREDVVLYAQALFSASLLLYPLRGFGRKNAVAAPLAAVLLLLAPACVFWNFHLAIMVDGLLGVLFGFALAVEMLGSGGRFDRALQAMALAMLPLVKSAGLMLALLAVAVIAASRLWRPKAVWRAHKGGTQKAWLSLILPLASTLAAAGAWALYLLANQVPRRWAPGGFSPGAFLGLFTGGAPGWQRQTVQSYFANIFADTNYGWPVGFMPYMGFFVVFLGAWLLLRRPLAKEKRPRWDAAFWGLWGAGILYTLSLLFTYLYFFNKYEAVRLASLSRYLNTYLAAMLVFLAAWLAHNAAQAKGARGWAPPLLASLGVWTVLSNPVAALGPLATAPQTAVSTTAALQPYAEAAAAITQYAPEDEAMVYVISQDDIGATTLWLDYELFPRRLHEQVSSIGPAYAPDDLLGLRVTREEWAQLLLREGYAFVYLFHTDDAFNAEFGPLFEDGPEEKAMYRVLPQNGGTRLEKVTG